MKHAIAKVRFQLRIGLDVLASSRKLTMRGWLAEDWGGMMIFPKNVPRVVKWCFVQIMSKKVSIRKSPIFARNRTYNSHIHEDWRCVDNSSKSTRICRRNVSRLWKKGIFFRFVLCVLWAPQPRPPRVVGGFFPHLFSIVHYITNSLSWKCAFWDVLVAPQFYVNLAQRKGRKEAGQYGLFVVKQKPSDLPLGRSENLHE